MSTNLYEEVLFDLSELFQPAMGFNEKAVVDFLRERFVSRDALRELRQFVADAVTLAEENENWRNEEINSGRDGSRVPHFAAARRILDANDRL